jgi:Rieske Fe-S protein
VLGPWLERQLGPGTPTGRRAPQPLPVSPERRLLLHAGVLAAAAFVLAIISRPLKDLLMPGGATGANGAGAGAVTAPGASGQAGAASAAPVAGTGAGAGGASALGIATTAQVAQAGAFQFQVPVAMGNASPGDPGIVVSLGSSKYAAFDAVCTHAGCTVGWDPGAGMLICPCHGATFDPRNNGQAVAGPTNVPLTELPIAISSSGEISLRA